MSEILVVEKLVKKFGNVRALDCTSFKASENSISLLMGPNGSGKTTLINCISGLYTPDEGRIEYRGMDITGKPPHKIVGLGLGRTFQVPAPFRNLTVMENMLACYKNHPGENLSASLFKRAWMDHETTAIKKAFEILETLDIQSQANNLACELSGGQLKLLELARLLMLDVKMCLLDEPVGSINPVLSGHIFSHIRKVRDALGMTFLLVEHRIDLAMKYVDYVYALSKGKVIFEGTPEEASEAEELYEIYL